MMKNSLLTILSIIKKTKELFMSAFNNKPKNYQKNNYKFYSGKEKFILNSNGEKFYEYDIIKPVDLRVYESRYYQVNKQDILNGLLNVSLRRTESDVNSRNNQNEFTKVEEISLEYDYALKIIKEENNYKFELTSKW